jgi:hypothetical protein
VLACALLTALLVAAGNDRAPRRVQVHLNDRPLAPAVVLEEPGGRRTVYVAVTGLARAIGGSDRHWRRWLRLEGSSLFAAAEGGCAACIAHVRRPVLISSRLRMIGSEPHLPLADLVAAFEGKLSADEPSGVYTIFTGSCTWCVLEVRD